MTSHTFGTFEDFWPYYVSMHSRRATRWIHLSGTFAGALITATALATASWPLVPALAVLGYGAAWPSHWLVERNNPATFGHPAWSLRGDIRMIRTMLAGRDSSLECMAIAWLESHPEDRSSGSVAAGTPTTEPGAT